MERKSLTKILLSLCCAIMLFAGAMFIVPQQTEQVYATGDAPASNSNADFVKFTSNATFTITVGENMSYENTLWYSIDKSTWTEISKGESATANLNNSKYTLYFAGSGNTVLNGIGGDTDDYHLSVVADGDVSISGNIMTLLDYENPNNVTMGARAFAAMFDSWSNLVDASGLTLPATTLSDDCYRDMFSFCSNLVYGPVSLPAETLPAGCYYQMFGNCSKLVKTPTISATTMGNFSCTYMFTTCSTLVRLPELSVTTLGNYSCDGMFKDCENIKLTEESSDNAGSWSIPSGATGGSYPFTNMIIRTGGDFTDDPVAGTTYYYMPDTTNYIKFTSTATFSVTPKGNWERELQYSTDNIYWYPVTKNTAITSSTASPYDLYFRGLNNTIITGGDSYTWVLTPAKNKTISVSGDIMTLLDYEGDVTILTEEDFEDDDVLYQKYGYDYDDYLDAMGVVNEYSDEWYNELSEQYDNDFSAYLEAMGKVQMGANAFAYMFKGQTSLVSLPTLSATSLADNCYAHMFENCTGILLSETGEVGSEWIIPSEATGGANQFTDMFKGTSGTFSGTPDVGTIYYLPASSSGNQSSTPGTGVYFDNTAMFISVSVMLIGIIAMSVLISKKQKFI